MAYDIGPKIGIEGEAEYRRQLQQIITSQKTLATEMTATASAFDKGEKSVKSYRAQNEVLERQIEAQKNKMELLRRTVAEASAKYGDADERTQKWQQTLNRATAELNNMENELESNKKAIDQLRFDKLKDTISAIINIAKTAADAAKNAAGSIGSIAESVFSGIVSIAKAAAKAVREVADAMISCATDAAAFGDDMATLSVQTGVSTETLQQFDYMAGLIDVDLGTITGALSKTTKQMAKGSDAFDTLGVSIRDANGELRDNEDVFFEAIDALGKIKNETERDALAMELFGKSAQELNPLIAAGSDRLKELAEEANNVGYVLSDETISALTAGQDELDRFAKASEAAKNAVGAQLLPSLANLAKGGSSIASAFAVALNETGSVSSALSAGKDMAMQVLQGFSESAPETAEAAGALVSQLGVSIVSMTPQILDLGLDVIEGLATGIADNADSLASALSDAVILGIDSLVSHAGDMIDVASRLIESLASGLLQAAPYLILQVPKLISTLLKGLRDGITGMLGVGAEMGKNGIANSLLTAITGSLSEFITVGADVAKSVLAGIIESAPEMAQAAGELLSELAVDIVQMAPQLIELGLVVLEAFVSGLAENTDVIIPAVVDAIGTITNTLISHIPELISVAGQLLGALTSGLIQAIPHLVMQIPEIILAILIALGEGFASFISVGENMVKGIWEGIKDSIAWVKQKISEWVGEVVGFFKDMLGIASPSKVMADQVGEQMAAGVGEGFTDGLTDVERDMAAAQEDLNRKMAGMAAGLESSVTVNAGAGPIEHRFSGTIRVEGVGSQGEFIASTDILIDQIVDALRREARFA